MLEALKFIDDVSLNMGGGSSLVLNLSIAFIMFGVALELDLREFVTLFKSPKPVFVGIFSQFLLMPALTFGLVIIFRNHITLTVGLGMILVAACPGGNLSNFFSNLARGNLALSVSLTAFSGLGGFVLTSLNFVFWGNLYLDFYTSTANVVAIPHLEIPFWIVMQTIFIMMGIPMVLGVLFRHRFPKITLRIVVTIKRISILFFFTILGILFSRNLDNLFNYIFYVFILVFIHNLIALAAGYGIARMSGLKKKDRKTISIETGIQNTSVAIVLLLNPEIFPADMAKGGLMFMAVGYGVWHFLSGLIIAGIWSGFSLKPRTGIIEAKSGGQLTTI